MNRIFPLQWFLISSRAHTAGCAGLMAGVLLKVYSRTFAFVFFVILMAGFRISAQEISLAGKWKFKLDSLDKGVKEKWFNQVLPETVGLPGSMAGNLKGEDITLKTKWTGSIYDSSFYYNPRLQKYREPGNIKIPFWLTPAKHYTGAAWYQKEISIPESWKNKDIGLELEYAHGETTVWIDGRETGTQFTFVSAQHYQFGRLAGPGKHVITIRIDNRIKEINVGQDSHSLTDHTQGNWNGIVGKLRLFASPVIRFEDIQVYPDLKKRSARVTIQLCGPAGSSFSGKVELRASSFNTSVRQILAPVSADFKLKNGRGNLNLDLPMGGQMQLWDEFDPALYRLTVQLSAPGKFRTAQQVTFGMREFTISGREFRINGRPVFLRGTVNNCEFPLTGYPAMDEQSWARIFKIARAHGLNHMRFHSWCPPEAAFRAADKAGFYLQPEGPSWANHGTSIGDGKPVDQFIYDETGRMAKAYGNYASFCMLAYGNEPRGKQVQYLTQFNQYWINKDPRRVYTGASVGGSWPVIPNNQYMVRGGARGLAWDKLPETVSDYGPLISSFSVPFVAHEMGQYCVFPDFKEIKAYTGIYRARNFELFQEDLKDHDMGDQAEAFLMASGKLQALAYKHEIEKALRSPGYAGYQLLSLNDYPGQGTALVGVLNAFWEEKGYISPAEFSRFSNSTVLLARIPKFVFTSNEVFRASIEVAHFGKSVLRNAVVAWKITNPAAAVIASGKFGPKDLPLGNGTGIGELNLSLQGVTAAQKLHLEVQIEGTSFANGWDFWVYPDVLPPVSGQIYYCKELDSQAKAVLAGGGKVFLNAAGKVVKGKEVVQTFLPVFWNTSWFKMRPPHTLGILCDPKHPAFSDFPTASFSEMQWWEIVNQSQVMNLEDFPRGFRPLVQPIDTWFLNRKLGLIFEARVGKGTLLVSSADLSEDPATGPAAKQLYYSLIHYLSSSDLPSAMSVDEATIADLFISGSKLVFDTHTKDSPDELKPKPAN